VSSWVGFVSVGGLEGLRSAYGVETVGLDDGVCRVGWGLFRSHGRVVIYVEPERSRTAVV